MYATDADTPVPLELPNQWLWDIIDEFIYQVGNCFLFAIISSHNHNLGVSLKKIQIDLFSL